MQPALKEQCTLPVSISTSASTLDALPTPDQSAVPTALEQLRQRSPPWDLLYLYISMAFLSQPLLLNKLRSNRHVLKLPTALLFSSFLGQTYLSDTFSQVLFLWLPLKWWCFRSSTFSFSHSTDPLTPP